MEIKGEREAFPMTPIKAPFFEIGPKSYLYGQDVIDLAKAADAASEKYDVDIIFTTPVVEIARVKAATRRISCSISTEARTQTVAPTVHSARDRYSSTRPGLFSARIKRISPYSHSTSPSVMRKLGSLFFARERRSTVSARALAA